MKDKIKTLGELEGHREDKIIDDCNTARSHQDYFTEQDEADLTRLVNEEEWVPLDLIAQRLKHIVFWRNGELTCEQEVEKFLCELGIIETKDKKIKANMEKNKQ